MATSLYYWTDLLGIGGVKRYNSPVIGLLRRRSAYRRFIGCLTTGINLKTLPSLSHNGD